MTGEIFGFNSLNKKKNIGLATPTYSNELHVSKNIEFYLDSLLFNSAAWFVPVNSCYEETYRVIH